MAQTNPFVNSAINPLTFMAPDVALDATRLARQQALVDALRQKAADDPETQVVSGIAIQNGMAPLSKLANALIADRKQKTIDEQQAALAQRYAKALTGQSATGGTTGTAAGTPSLQQIMLYNALGIPIPPKVAERMMGVEPNKEIVKVDTGNAVNVYAVDPVTGGQTLVQTLPKGVSPDTTATITSREGQGELDRQVTTRGQDMSARTAAAGQAIEAARLGKPEYVTGQNGAVYAMPGVTVPGYPSAQLPAAQPAMPAAGGPPAMAPTAPTMTPPTAPPTGGVQVVVPGKTVADKAAEAAAIERAQKEAANSVEATQKREGPAFGVREVIGQARGLLKGVDVRATANNNGQPVEVATPTNSVIGSGLDWAGSLIGAAPDSAVTAERLRVLSGKLIQSVPRFEGAQSDADRKSYEQLAGRVGDSSIPIERRLAALDELEAIVARYDRSAPSNTTSGWSIRPAGK